ncbi:helicase-related protein [Cryobacterium lyxosi]|uniref:Helicase n=1 Tax=Cryobacterium lyxosi TaxID=1259228 RepID=A0A4R8ZGA1_9MICO|nr:helicase-related protein [Cryobacterium lyxosi]TFD25166.1 helicase [Cryobacterium lyxosi]
MDAKTKRRQQYVDYLRSQYLGPSGGDDELLASRPDKTYLVGTLFPRGRAASDPDVDVNDGDVGSEDGDEAIESANDWHPSSAALSFIHNGDSLECKTAFATYAKEDNDGPGSSWRRSPVLLPAFFLSPAKTFYVPEVPGARVRVTSRWRRVLDQWMVTVAIENLIERSDPEDKIATQDCVFQTQLSCVPIGGEVLPYRTTASVNMEPEECELALRYRDARVYAVGHGTSSSWEAHDGRVRSVAIDFLPTVTVPAIAAVAGAGERETLRLSFLSDASVSPEVLADHLNDFVSDYESWVDERENEARGLPSEHAEAAVRIIERMRRAVLRMRGSITVLTDDPIVLKSFRLAMIAMREQMLQSGHARRNPGKRSNPLVARSINLKEPEWFPFQLGFLLVSLESTAYESHADRSVVDLIWFPTGGGKTEAYLALAAFEMVRRRLTRGVDGGGTAVITRYTLRLLTTQQFQRAATLICALQLLREKDKDLQRLPAFTIGLWLGDATTPNKLIDAVSRLDETYKALKPENPFQLEACPWCGTNIIPETRVDDRSAYGANATKNDFYLYCPHKDCAFATRLPIDVVDEQMYLTPPTMLMGTVDKFARLPISEAAGSLLGRGSSPFDAPSLIIQDELHLLSGPLGTTVAVYEAAIQSVLSWGGSRPKIVASTATIRAASEQVKGLFAAEVELYPASGLSADDSYFARVDREAPGRLYIGLMPQAFTQSSSVVRSLTGLLEAPLSLLDATDEDLDAYWTVVAYHNSLRELGRTVTIARDDVESLLRTRGIGGAKVRSIRGDGVEELTSHVQADQLPKILARLERRYGSGDAVDVAATTNMLSVGIDVSRLGVMLMNGQPKTTSEYIQATSRVGRGPDVPGVVVTLFRATKPRDRSHYETFRGYHEALYRYVEPTSVTPWSIQSRHRAMAAALVLLVRHGAGLRANSACGDFDASSVQVRHAITALKTVIKRVDPDEADSAFDQLDDLISHWTMRVADAAAEGETLQYEAKKGTSLLKNFGDVGVAWPVMNSMRSVDRAVRVIVRGEKAPA